MIGVHVEFVIQPGQEPVFLEWKRREGELHHRAPGFLKRSLTRDVDRPNVFYFVTLWESQDAIDTFKATPAFNETLRDSGVSAVILGRTVATVTEVFDEPSRQRIMSTD